MFLLVRDKWNNANGVRRRSLSTACQKRVLWSSCRASGGWKFNVTGKLKRLLLFTCDVWVWLLTNELVFKKMQDSIQLTESTARHIFFFRLGSKQCEGFWWSLITGHVIRYLVTKPYKAQWSLRVPPALTLINSTFRPHSAFMCFVWIWEQTAIISLYSINWLVFITETDCLLRGTNWIFN